MIHSLMYLEWPSIILLTISFCLGIGLGAWGTRIQVNNDAVVLFDNFNKIKNPSDAKAIEYYRDLLKLVGIGK